MKKEFIILVFLFVTGLCFGQETCGIFYKKNDSDLIQLDYSRISGSSVSNIVGAYFTLGLSSAKSNKTIEGASAEIVIDKKDKTPNFVFIFGKDTLTNYMFAKPNNLEFFKLIKLKKKKKSRQLRNGKYGLVAGVQNGLNEDDIIPIKIIKKEDNSYLVIPKEKLKKGEYCFYFTEKAPEGTNEFQSVFDFSIQ